MKAQALRATASSRRNAQSNAAAQRQVAHLARRTLRRMFAPNLTMAIVAVGTLGIYAAALMGDDKAAGTLALISLPWLTAAIGNKPTATKKGGKQ